MRQPPVPASLAPRPRSSAETGRRSLLILFSVVAVLTAAGLAFPILNYIYGFYHNRTFQQICLFALAPLWLVFMARPLVFMASTLWGKRRRVAADNAANADAIARAEIETRPQRRMAGPDEVLRIPIRMAMFAKLLFVGGLFSLAALFGLYHGITGSNPTDIVMGTIGSVMFLTMTVMGGRAAIKARRDPSSEMILTAGGMTLEKIGSFVPWDDVVRLQRSPNGRTLSLICRAGSLAPVKRNAQGPIAVRDDRIIIALPWLNLPTADALAAIERFGGIRETAR